jgi:hypothetical protein
VCCVVKHAMRVVEGRQVDTSRVRCMACMSPCIGPWRPILLTLLLLLRLEQRSFQGS